MKTFSLQPALSKVLLPTLMASLMMTSCASPAVDLLPTFNKSYYVEGQLVEKHIGKLIAIDGKVVKIEPGPEKKPILQVQLSGVDKKLWVGSLANITIEMVPLGSHIKVLGFLDETSNEPIYMQKLTQDREYLLGFCFRDMQTNLPSYLTRWLKKCVDWETGENIKEISH
ncbi:MAG: hypothetical protein ACI9FJ_002613 [Alteromonadaceae bacterium]|jgi:hypothetical protein